MSLEADHHDKVSITPYADKVPAERMRAVRRVTAWGLVGNLFLAGAKFAAGIFGSSQALVADAVHSLSDTVTDMAVIIGSQFWAAPADTEHPHGHGRIEAIITLVIGIALAAVGLGLAYNAVATMHRPAAHNPGWIAFAVACISIGMKEWLYRWTISVGRRVRSSALVANAWHHRSDALSSVPVAIAVLGTRLRPDWYYLDQVAAVIVAVLILRAAGTIVWQTLAQLADRGVSDQQRAELYRLARETDGVRTVHGLRTRHIGAGVQVDLHVMVDPELSVRDGHLIAHQVRDHLLREDEDVVDVLVHIEPDEPELGLTADDPYYTPSRESDPHI